MGWIFGGRFIKNTDIKYNVEPELNQNLISPITTQGHIDYVDFQKCFITKNLFITDNLFIIGWIIDSINQEPIRKVSVFLNEIEFIPEIGLARQDVALYFDNPNYYPSGFRLNQPLSDIKPGKYVLSIRAISNCGNHVYTLNYPEKIFIVKNNFIWKAQNRFQKVKIKIIKKIDFFKRMRKANFFFLSLGKNVLYLLYLYFIKNNIIFVALENHIGDIIACEPITRKLREEYPKGYFAWITNYSNKSLVQYNPNVNLVLGVTSLYEWSLLKKVTSSFRVVDLHIDKKPCPIFSTEHFNPNSNNITLENYFSRGNILQSFLLSANLSPTDMTPLFHFKNGLSLQVPAQLIVFHCQSNESVKNWLPENWNKLYEDLISKGFSLAEVGIENIIQSNAKNYYNYCGKLSFQEIAWLIKHAKAFIGIDSAFAHFANAVNTPGVVLLGQYRAFKKYMPYSGRYGRGENAIIIQYPGFVKNIPIELVIQAANNILNQKEYHGTMANFNVS